MTTILHVRATRLLGAILCAAVLCGAVAQSEAPRGVAASNQQSIGLLAKIKQAGVIKVGLAVDPPFTLRRTDGTWYSFNPTLVRMYARHLGVKVDLVPTGWATIVAGLQAGQYDIIGASISATPERKKAIDFTVPYAYGGTTWLVRKDNPKHPKKTADLNSSNFTIAYSTNTFQDEITHRMMPKANYRGLPNASIADLLSELASQRSDAVAIPSFLDRAIVSKFPYSIIPNNYKGVSPTGIAWGIRKGNADLRQNLSAFIRAETRNGSIAKLMKKDITPANALSG